VRSHKHLMRTAPKSNRVMTCDYDDGPGNGEDGYRDGSLPFEEADDETEAKKKKKRKASGDPKRKNKKDEEDDETEKLRKKIGTSHFLQLLCGC